MEKGKILVTGGAGYIGSHTAWELVQSGYEPVLIDNFSKSDTTLLDGLEKLMGRKPLFYQGDCVDIGFLKHLFSLHQFKAVIHFAAYKAVGESVQFPIKYYQNNINSLLSLLDVMEQERVFNLIFSSSCTVYGQPKTIPVAENAPFQKAESPYGATKQLCEHILEDTPKQNFRIISLRYFNPIGAHPTSLLGELPIGVPGNLVPFVTQTAIGKREKLVVFGNDYNTPDGSNIRDFIHIVDLAKAHVSALTHLLAKTDGPAYDFFNLGTGQGNSVLEVIRVFEQVNNVKLNFEVGPRRSGDVEKTYADVTKARTVLGWKAELTLEDALRDAWNWEKKLAAR